MKNYEEGTPILPDNIKIKIAERGPYLLFGNIPIKQQSIMPNHEGESWQFVTGTTDYNTGSEPVALCRCGQSHKKPYCDGTHTKIEWDDRLTAPRTPLLDDVQTTEGQTLTLTDNILYCAFARFCDAKGRTWNLTENSHDQQSRKLAIQTANNCPAGRLKQWDKTTGNPLEPKLEPMIGLIQDPALHVSGGVWAMGGIPVIAPDGYVYQVRNRVTLCRCGYSNNKPFCDGTHTTAQWRDNIPHEFKTEETI